MSIIRTSPSYRALALSSRRRDRIPRARALSLLDASMEPEVVSYSSPNRVAKCHSELIESRGRGGLHQEH